MSAHEEIVANVEQKLRSKRMLFDNTRIARLCLRYWPDDMPTSRTPANEANIEYRKIGLRDKVKDEYGSIWVLLLAPLITYAINALLDWWFGAHDQRALMLTAIEQERVYPEP